MYCQSGNMSVTYGVLKTGHGWLAALQQDNYLLIKIWIWYLKLTKLNGYKQSWTYKSKIQINNCNFWRRKNLILDLMHEMLILVKVIKVIQIQQTIFENSKKNEEPGQ